MRGRRHDTAVSQFRNRNRRKEQKKRRGIRFPRWRNRQWVSRGSMTMATRYFVYRGPAFHSRDETTDATATSVVWLRRWPGNDLLPPILIERKRFIAPCAHRLDSPCNGGSFCRPFHSGKTSCRGLSVTRKILEVLSIHYGCTFLLMQSLSFPFFLSFPISFVS